MRNRILNNWNFMRVLKLAFGFYATQQAIQLQQYFLLILAALFFYQSIWNVSACGMAGSCEIKPKAKAV